MFNDTLSLPPSRHVGFGRHLRYEFAAILHVLCMLLSVHDYSYISSETLFVFSCRVLAFA